MSEPILYLWPQAARFGRVVPKTKFYERGAITKSLRKKFVGDVQRITWAYKLADHTVHLRSSAAVPEIQVFVIDTKEGDVSDDVLAAIDRTVRFPIFFEINDRSESQDRIRTAAAHKQLEGQKIVLSTYFSTDWLPSVTQRHPLPTALDLPSLYRGLMAPLLPIDSRPGETLREATGRIALARNIEREITALKRQIGAEAQFNRRVELRRKLQDRAATLTQLVDPTQSKC